MNVSRMGIHEFSAPAMQSAEAAGYDLQSLIEFKLFPGQRKLVPTGWAFQIPVGMAHPLFGDGPFRANLRCLMAASDVTWSARDPWPLLSQPYTSWPIIEMAMRRRCTFGEVAMLDLAWAGA